jgi:signal recognition particle subunit SRP54
VKFAGTGEKLTDLEPFYPDRIASRILGMGDVLSLIEKAEESIDAQKAEEQARRVMQAKFTLEDFLEQIQAVRKMGGITDIMKMLPGMPGGRRLSDINVQDSDVDRIEAIIRSMTPAERRDPRIISGSRRARIAYGSGSQIREVNDLLKQFEAARKMMKQMSKLRPGKKHQAFNLPPGFEL